MNFCSLFCFLLNHLPLPRLQFSLDSLPVPLYKSAGMLILTTGGTIDKIYFDANSKYEIGEPTIPHIFQETGVTLPYEMIPLMRKDSLDLDNSDRSIIRQACETSTQAQIMITHGTDTMCETALHLIGIPGKTIVLTGALAPSRFRITDAVFNVGTALGAAQSKPPGVYIAMNGRIFDAANVRKNRSAGRFEQIDPTISLS